MIKLTTRLNQRSGEEDATYFNGIHIQSRSRARKRLPWTPRRRILYYLIRPFQAIGSLHPRRIPFLSFPFFFLHVIPKL
uniref:Uncharacterized protein n=1 Tax=Lepeophtheirus salmonis TaxID=72036 RepID=A0A0K2SV30_LEPSM